MNWLSLLDPEGVAVAPSLLGADLARIDAEVDDLAASGADLLHLDIMDGHFVPNISFGAPVCQAVAGVTDLPLDAHLMIANPDKYLADFHKAGCRGITIHLEAVEDPASTLEEIRSLGSLAGLAVNPDTPLPAPGPLWAKIDLLLVMSVFPGFCGQSFREEVLPKLVDAKKIRDEMALGFAISIDGGIGPDNAAVAREAGADILVAASSVCGQEDRKSAIAALRA